uniref:ATP-dependent Clp protease proteolytic subunit n=1 Tax=Ligustrum ovalifolium TaxID=126436 RepID=UPI001BEFA4AE|nr:ATP-dependent Clp protease proteolytic subunit [Ligustrum ovalifolium]YP_010691579.1 ATP-dependent Clp protease proteolytic subunit 1 [Ligustrum x vicaryi]QIV67196.1 ATP-dependent Clp protease proteolytic subunit [Ligustrum ovalifolium]WBU94307.1 ATP-dependent Clp protease proteolytic subunit 1 [Ligustrum x vicaryi]WBU94396.1 ATP-dependent Clp protease proteolytic subunit 1 [Ligustrum ovalifolium]
MPVGVPKVPFLIPGEEEATWVDLYNRLYRRRALFLCQEVDYEMSNQIIGLMTFLTIEDRTLDQHLFINSPGGGLIPGIALFDVMQLLPPTMHTICMGVAASMASLILSGGAITQRLAFPHARVMIHQPASSFFESQTGECVLEINQLMELRAYVERLYVETTGQPLWVIVRDLERDVFMSATEAIDYGIVDFNPEDVPGFCFSWAEEEETSGIYDSIDL